MAGIAHLSKHLANGVTDVGDGSGDAADALPGPGISLLTARELDGRPGGVHELGYRGTCTANDHPWHHRRNQELDKCLVVCCERVKGRRGEGENGEH